jgi:YidC/Oxa1 family membrane protein insertase
MQQNRNLLIFFLVSLTLYVGLLWAQKRFWPQPKEAVEEKPAAQNREEKKPETGLGKLPAQPTVTPQNQLVSMGDAAVDSRFHLYVELDPLGAGVRKIVLNKFEQATSGGLPAGEQLSLVSPEANLHEPSFVLYHFAPDDTKLEHPLDTLGRTVWKVVKHGGKDVVETDVDGKKKQSVAFRAEVLGITITKTYSLTEGEYHIGLTVDMERAAFGVKGKPAEAREVKFRYQLTGAKGLPIEGKWYTTTYRNAFIGTQVDRGGFVRDIQDLRQISIWGGGNRIEANGGQALRYASVAVQYFASVIVVDDLDQPDQKFLHRAQATLENVVARGKVKGGNALMADRLVVQNDDGKTQETIFVPPHLRDELFGLKEGTPVAVVYRPLVYDVESKQTLKQAVSIHVGDDAARVHPLWEDDITVRVTTEAVELKPGTKVSHRYLLYNGPVKPSLLGQLTGEKAVSPELVERYSNTLQLNTMTDYHSPGWFGSIFNTIGWTWVIIKCTNLMHWVLGLLHTFVVSYGTCIVLLTVMVRGLMFPLSRKQALMSVKMQVLAPELKKLQEKHKDDKQALGMAQWELYRKHGVNPLGSCWVLLLQMPIFMGLYYALQESIQFRLAPFWPTWVKNLAAPDMLLYWGESIPLVSRPEDFGGFLYLGPYLNILPIIAVAFMLVQQKMMMPPPTDEQQAMQQKMMKWMMVVMGLMFYKVAAGLCIYFIATTLWGFAERKLLPKSKLAPPAGDSGHVGVLALPTGPNGGDQITTAPRSSSSTVGSTNIIAGRRPARGKRRQERGRTATTEEEPKTGFGAMMKRLRDWWNDVLEQARKK